MRTAQHTRPCTLFGLPRSAAWQLKNALLRRISAAPRGAVIGKNFILLFDFFLLTP